MEKYMQLKKNMKHLTERYTEGILTAILDAARLAIQDLQEENLSLRTEKEKLQEELKFYASDWNHDVQIEDIGITSMQRDRGDRARKALSKKIESA